MHHRRLRLAAPIEKEIELLPALVERGKIAIDIGAGKGLYVDHLRGLGANVVAFEPYPQLAQELQRFYRGSVNVQDVALSDRRGRAPLRLRDATRGVETVNVEVRTLDEYDFRDVAFIKIDVDGHEEAVLKGAQRTLTTNRPSLLIEIEERHNAGSIERVAKMLAALGYREYFLSDDELHGYEDFDAARHQPPRDVGERGKTRTYVNNFMFVHSARATAVFDKLRSRGLKVL
jgi:FkbM family methyltransferase